MTLLREARGVAAAWLALVVLLSGAVVIAGCDDGSGGGNDSDVTDGESPRDGGRVTIFSFDPSTTQGAAPLEVSFDVLFRTDDPVSDVDVEVDFGDGSEPELVRTRTRLTPNATPDELRTPEEREVTVRHIFEEPGEYTVRLRVRDVQNSTASRPVEAERSVTVTITELPDLIATSVSASAQQLEIDEVFSMSFSVLNDGSDVPRGFFAQLLLVDSPSMQLADLSDTTRWIELGLFPVAPSGLPRDTSLDQTESVQLCDPRTGAAACETLRARLEGRTWYAAVLIDPPNPTRPQLNLQESNETNNFRIAPAGITVAGRADLPDLLPRNVIANPATTDVLTSVSVTFEVTNIGEQPAPPTRYSIFLSEGDRTLDPTDLPLGSGDLPPVLVGGTQVVASLSFPLEQPITLPGEFWVLVRADDEAAVEERNETNNLAAGSRSIRITGAQRSNVDIAPSDLVVTPDQTYIGGQFQVDFSVTNLGTDDPGTYQCALYLSPDDTLQPNTDSLLVLVGEEILPGGKTDHYSRVLYVSNFTPPGTYYVFVVCDPQGRIAELDETNNVIGPSTPLVVNAAPQIDYTVRNLTISDTTIAEQGDLTVTVEVCNVGIDAAGPVLVRAYLSPDANIDPGDPVLQGKLTTTPALATNACETVTLSGKVGCLPFVDVYTVGVIVDPTSSITEISETNNVIAGPANGLTVTGGQGSLCACVEDSLEETNGNNDTETTASPVTLSAGTPRTASLEPLALCNATDFYQFQVDRGDTVTATVTYDASIARLGMRLFDPTGDGTPREVVDNNGTGTLTLTEQVLGTSAQETVLVEVYPLTGGARNYYRLDLSVQPAPVEPDLQIPEITLVTGAFPSILEPVVWDVAVLNTGLNNATNVQVTTWLSTNTTLDAADLEVGSQIIPVVASQATETITFSYTFPSGTPSTNYYVIARVDPLQAIPEVVETNNERVSARFTLDADCFADAFEGPNGNDTFATAWPVRPSTGGIRTYDNLSVCNNGRVDHYLVCVPAGEPLHHVGIIQHSASAASASEITLFKRDQVTQLGTATHTALDLLSASVPELTCTTDTDCSTGETCTGGYCIDEQGETCVFARVALRSTATVIARPYTLVVDTAPAHQAGEPTNDTRPNGVPFSPALGSIAAGSGHATSRADIDWFRLNLPAGTQFTVHFETADDDLRLTVYAPSSALVDPWKSRSYTLNQAQLVEFQVHKVNSTSPDRPSAYRIRLEGLEGLDLQPLRLTQDLTEIANGGSVLLTWDLANERLDDTLTPVTYRYVLSTDDVLDASDYEVGRETVAGPDGLSAINIQEKVYATLPPDVFGDLRLFVEVDPANVILEVNEANNSRSVPLTVHQLCLPDANENNNTIATATPISAPFTANDLTVCAGDADLFAVTVPAGATYQFSISDMVVWSHGDIDLFLLESNGVVLARSDALNTPSEIITWTNTGATRTVYLQVLPFRSDSTNRYDLTVVQQ